MSKHHHHSHVLSLNTSFSIAISLTIAYIILEVFYGVLAHSMSLLADATHNLGDTLGLILAWLANWLLTIPAKKHYSYGFKRLTIMASLSNAFILIVTSIYIAYESIHKLFHLSEINETTVILISVIGIIVNIGCSMLFIRDTDDINIRGAFLHLLADALILVGVITGALITKFTHILWVDPMISLIIVAIVLWGTWGLLRDSLHFILDGIPRFIDHAGVREYLEQFPGVKAIHDLHIWGLSTREIALTAHLIMPEKKLSDEDHQKINNVLQEKFNISHATLQVEAGGEGICSPCHLT